MDAARKEPMPLVSIPSRNIAFDAHDLVSRVRRGRLLVSPSYQRMSVCSTEQRQALVKSWLMGLPIPAVVVNDRVKAGAPLRSDAPTAAVVDGKQRIETAIAWMSNELHVPADWFRDQDVATMTDDGLVSWDGLTEQGRRMAMPIPMVETYVKTEADEAALFLILNASGVSQTNDDLARARTIAQEA